MEAAAQPTPTETSPEITDGATGSGVTPEGKSEGTQRESGERDDTGRHLSREVAGYRRRLRETEAERDRFAARLDDAGEGGFATGRSASCASSARGASSGSSTAS